MRFSITWSASIRYKCHTTSCWPLDNFPITFSTDQHKYYYRLPKKLLQSNAFIDVCLSVSRLRGSGCDHYPWWIGPHCTGSTVPLDIRHGIPIQPQSHAWVWAFLLVTSCCYHWRPVQNCSLKNPLTGTDIYCMYSLQVGGAHPTGMFLLFKCSRVIVDIPCVVPLNGWTCVQHWPGWQSPLQQETTLVLWLFR